MYQHRRLIVLVVSAVIALLLFGCGDEDVQAPDTTPPYILSTSPPDASEGAPASSQIVAVFSEKIDPASVDTSTFHLYECCPPDCVGIYGDEPRFVSVEDFDPQDFTSFSVPCSVACNGAEVVLIPDEILKYQMWYTALIANDVQDLAGNKMEDDHLWFFKTGSRDALPMSGVKVAIEHLKDVYQGHYAYVDVTLQNDSTDFELGGFDLCIAYDASALTLMSVGHGYPLAGCWEYFTHRQGFAGDCHGPCPSGMLRVVGIADTSDGDNHPDSTCTIYSAGSKTVLTTLTFYVTNDRVYECLHIPIRFVWTNCGDNVLTDLSGQDLWLWNNVYDYDSEATPPYSDITGQELYGGHVWSECNGSNAIDFYDGGVDIICSDSINGYFDTGDLNGNRIPYEIADAVLYTDYFIYGLGAFVIDQEAQILASETNEDGEYPSIADFVYLMRVITGDALPYHALTPYADTVAAYIDGQTAWSISDTDIGAALFAFWVDEDTVGGVTSLVSGMEVKSDVVDGQLRVLIYSIGTDYIPSGNNDLFTIETDAILLPMSITISDYSGNMMYLFPPPPK